MRGRSLASELEEEPDMKTIQFPAVPSGVVVEVVVVAIVVIVVVVIEVVVVVAAPAVLSAFGCCGASRPRAAAQAASGLEQKTVHVVSAKAFS